MGGCADPPCARRGSDAGDGESADNLGSCDSRLAEADDSGAGFRSPSAEQFVPFAENSGGNAVAEILDYRTYFSGPNLQ
jgi:hypothetical protein